MKYLYFPFQNDIDYDPSMPSNKKRYADNYGNNLQVIQYPGSLAQVQNDETLIVAGHGLPGNGKIGLSIDDPGTPLMERAGRFLGNHRPKTLQVTLQTNDLADRISQAGLNKGHKYIKLITCGGAGMAVADVNSIVWKDANVPMNGRKIEDVSSIFLASVSTADCLASVLAKAMAQPGRNFTRLLVRAYPGFVDANGVQKFLRLESSSGEGAKGVSKDTWTGVEHVYWPNKMMKVPISAIKDSRTGQKERFWFDSTGQRVSPV
jgi:hypothetical protein